MRGRSLRSKPPGHHPPPEEQDYVFSRRSLLTAVLLATFRALNSAGVAHSWLSDRFGPQHLDHIVVSTAAGTLTAYDHGHGHGPRT